MKFSFYGKEFKIVNKFFIFIAVSLAILLGGVVDIFVRGMNIGIEFSPGATVQVTIDDIDNFDETAFKTDFEKWFAGDRVKADGKVGSDGVLDADKRFDVSYTTRTSKSNGSTTFEFRYGNKMTEVVADEEKEVDLVANVDDTTSEYYGSTLLLPYTTEAVAELEDDIRSYITDRYGLTEDDYNLSIVPHTTDRHVTDNTVRTAFVAAGVAIAAILVYIMFRFTWVSGVAAILALVHDVAIMVVCTCFFQIPVNSTFIAAIITIIGYSINATIVIFDRIREYEGIASYDALSDTELANRAVTSTLTRSILTMLTTLVVIVLLAIFGNATIREFAFPIIFGLIAGAYSSVLLSASFWVYLRKLFKQSGKRHKKKSLKRKTA